MTRWKDYLGEVETDSLWLFSRRDRGASHAGDYHGNFIPQIPQQLFHRFTRQGDAVVDLFLGMGTTLIECRRMGRHGIGVELLGEVAERARERIEQTENGHGVTTRVLVGSSALPETRDRVLDALRELGKEQAELVILHPPYSDIIQFSGGQDAQDLSHVQSDEEFLERFASVIDRSHELTAPGGTMAIVIGDKYARGQWVPLGFHTMQLAMDRGFTLKSIVVKDIQGNEKGKGKSGNLWKYRSLAQGYYLFRHEYVFVFQKPRRARKRPAGGA
jgi:DNA modification methylase